MARLTEENVRLAQEIISRYPRPRSATIPMLHLAQEQDGYVTEDASPPVAQRRPRSTVFRADKVVVNGDLVAVVAWLGGGAL